MNFGAHKDQILTHPLLSLPLDIERLQALHNLKTIEVQGPLHSVEEYYKICKSDFKNLSRTSFQIGNRDPLIIEIPNDRRYWNTNIGEQYFEELDTEKHN